MNILVTGSNGFIGTALCAYLKEKEYTIFECDRKIGFEVKDITKDYLEKNEINIVLHLAAQTSVWNEDHTQIIEDNITEFLHIFNLCKELEIKFIYASSSCSFNVTSMYGLSKQFEDNYAEIYGWDGCIGLRFHNVYGKDAREDTLLGICNNSDEIILYNNGENRRHFTYIDDTCKSIVKAFDLPKGIYNVCNWEEITTKQFVEEVCKYKPELKVIYTDEVRDYDKDSQCLDFRYQNILEYPFTSLENGIKKSFGIEVKEENYNQWTPDASSWMPTENK